MNQCEERWSARLFRARELERQHLPAESALALYGATLEFQLEVSRRYTRPVESQTRLRDQIDITALGSAIPGILAISERYGPEKLRAEAGRLRQAGVVYVGELLRHRA